MPSEFFGLAPAESESQNPSMVGLEGTFGDTLELCGKGEVSDVVQELWVDGCSVLGKESSDPCGFYCPVKLLQNDVLVLLCVGSCQEEQPQEAFDVCGVGLE